MNFLVSLRKPFKYRFSNCCLSIILLNVAVYVLTVLFPGLVQILALNVLYVVRGKMFWQFVTYMFVHDLRSISHLVFNMLGLFFFGLNVERTIGSKEFLFFYFVSGILCGLISFGAYFFTGEYYVFLMGASGAIYALLLVYAVIFPRSRIFIWGILPVPAPLLVLIYTGIALFSQMTSRGMGVAHLTHLAGFAVAWGYIRIRMGISPLKVWKDSYR
jgi:membrane associated rhomboid family serine protease